MGFVFGFVCGVCFFSGQCLGVVSVVRMGEVLMMLNNFGKPPTPNWFPDYLGVEQSITATTDDQAIHQGRLQDWRDYLLRYGSLPSILLTDSGWVVNGRHRLIVARETRTLLTGLIVKSVDGHYVATGNCCVVV